MKYFQCHESSMNRGGQPQPMSDTIASKLNPIKHYVFLFNLI